MIQRQTTFSLHNNSPSLRICKLLCHNNWAIIPDSTTIERGRETDMKWTRLLSWKHLIDVHQNLVFEMGKNRWGARVTGNRCNAHPGLNVNQIITFSSMQMFLLLFCGYGDYWNSKQNSKQYTENLSAKLQNSNQNSTTPWVSLIGLWTTRSRSCAFRLA